MAQTGSAQREPSMEEILASIRRIIEDSDTARRPLDENEPPELAPPPPAPPASAPVSASEAGREVEAFRAAFDDEPEMARDNAPGRSAVDLPEPDRPAPRAQEDVLPFGDSVPAHGPAHDDDEPAAPPAFGGEPAEPDWERDSGQDEYASDFEAAPSYSPPAEARPSLISDQAGRQVAAAFGELSEAFAASRRRSFDEMAEEMLRPMLQDWLDNNLPTLVERLVREEIERVARGG